MQIMKDKITANDRISDLGYADKQLKLNCFFSKSKRVEKFNRLIKKNIINTQRKDWN